jgi:hypothetical protein
MQDGYARITDALRELNAKNEQSAKRLKEISAKCNRPAGLLSNILESLYKDGTIKKVSKNGQSLYYLPNK